MIENKEQHDAAIKRFEQLMDGLSGDPDDIQAICEMEILADDIAVYEFKMCPQMRRRNIEKFLDQA